MICADSKNKAFTLIEAIASMVIVSVGTMALISSLKVGDLAAMRARMDARGAQEFAKQTQWVINYPSEQFRTICETHGNASWSDISYPTNGTALLIPQVSEFLLPAKSAFTYKTTMKVDPPPEAGDAYVVGITTEWETPSGSLSGPATRTNSLQMNNIRKW